jgi:hypothetical protein
MRKWNEFGRKWLWSNFEVLSRHRPRKTDENAQDSRFPGRDLNPEPPEYKESWPHYKNITVFASTCEAVAGIRCEVSQERNKYDDKPVRLTSLRGGVGTRDFTGQSRNANHYKVTFSGCHGVWFEDSARFRVPAAANMKMTFGILRPDDGGSMPLWNVGKLREYVAHRLPVLCLEALCHKSIMSLHYLYTVYLNTLSVAQPMQRRLILITSAIIYLSSINQLVVVMETCFLWGTGRIF